MTKRFGKAKPSYLSVTCRQDEDKGLIDRFKAVCTNQGLSVQQGLLKAVRGFLVANES